MIRDAIEGLHSPAGPAPRIACLVPSITELLCTLGLAPFLVARTGFCIHPRELVSDVPKVGGTKTVKLPRLRRLKPTHAVVNVDENTREVYEALREFVPSVIVTHPLQPCDNINLYRLIGQIFNRGAEAEALCRRYEEELARTAAECAAYPRERVLYLIWREPWMTVGPDTYIAASLRLAGLDTQDYASDARYPRIELDRATLARHDRILLSTEPYRFTAEHVSELRSLPGAAILRVQLIDGEMTSWYGSRAIAGLAYLRALRAMEV